MKQIYENATIDPFDLPSPSSESNKFEKPRKIKTFCDGFDSAEKIGKGIDFFSKGLDLDDFTRQTSFSTSVSSEGSNDIHKHREQSFKIP